MNLTKFPRPCHFGITILNRKRGNGGIPLYQTWHIVNSITLYHITSHSILSYHMVSHPIKLSYQIGPNDWTTSNRCDVFTGTATRFRIELGHAWFERVCFSCETYALLCGNCHTSKGKLCSLVNGHTTIYILKSLFLETWQFPHSNACASREKHTRSNHACPFQAQSETVVLYKYCV